MQWSEVRKAYPDQWLIIEALQAHTTPDMRRILDKIAIIERCSDGQGAMESYRRLHQQYPTREFFFVHTSREELDIHERQWLGIRRSNEIGNALSGGTGDWETRKIRGAQYRGNDPVDSWPESDFGSRPGGPLWGADLPI